MRLTAERESLADMKTRHQRENRRDTRIGIALMAVGAALMAIAVVYVEIRKAECRETGAHTVSLWGSWLCVSDDGRIVEVP